jgi:AraC family transcriptional regulator
LRPIVDNEIALEDLAEVANLSPAHLVRIYSRCVGEAPIATLRRLRLPRAFDVIGRGRGGRFTDVALDAGYASSAAFNHAFRKQFGIAPRDVPSVLQLSFVGPSDFRVGPP